MRENHAKKQKNRFSKQRVIHVNVLIIKKSVIVNDGRIN